MYILIHGNDQFHSKQKLNELVNDFLVKDPQISLNVIDYEEISTLGELTLDASPSFFSTKQLSILKSLHDSQKVNLASKSIEFLQQNPEQDIIFYEPDTLQISSELYINLKRNKDLKIFFYELPRYDNQKQDKAINFIIDELSSQKIKYDPKLPFQLNNLLGEDFFHIHNELKKIRYIKYGELLKFEDCLVYLTGNKESIIFSLIDGIFSSETNIKSLLEGLSTHLSDPNNFMLLVSLINRELRIHREKFTEKQLKVLYNVLLDIDIDYKTGGDPKSLLLKFYIYLHCPKYDYKWKDN